MSAKGLGPLISGYYSMTYNMRGILFLRPLREEGGDDGRLAAYFSSRAHKSLSNEM